MHYLKYHLYEYIKTMQYTHKLSWLSGLDILSETNSNNRLEPSL